MIFRLRKATSCHLMLPHSRNRLGLQGGSGKDS